MSSAVETTPPRSAEAGHWGAEIRSDVHVAFAARDSGGVEISLESRVAAYYGSAILEQTREVLSELGVKHAGVTIHDEGALPFVIAARIEAADGGPLYAAVRGGPLTSAGVAVALQRAAPPAENFHTHDLRRTVASLMYEIGISRDTIAAVVGHDDVGGRGSRTLIRHYLKSDLIARKTHALEAWEARLRSIISGDETGNVIQLRSTS